METLEKITSNYPDIAAGDIVLQLDAGEWGYVREAFIATGGGFKALEWETCSRVTADAPDYDLDDTEIFVDGDVAVIVRDVSGCSTTAVSIELENAKRVLYHNAGSKPMGIQGRIVKPGEVGELVEVTMADALRRDPLSRLGA